MADYIKVEWTEPSYGVCTMTKDHASQFNQYKDDVGGYYNNKHDILQNYSTQFPFKGDGKLYTYSYDDFLKQLPKSKIDLSSQIEKQFQYLSVNAVDKTFNYDEFAKNVPSASGNLKQDLVGYHDNNVCFSKSYNLSDSSKKPELIKINNGSTIKGNSICAMPVISDSATKISKEISNATAKYDTQMNSTINKVSSDSKGFFNKAYLSLKTGYVALSNTIKQYTNQFQLLTDKFNDAVEGAVVQANELGAKYKAAQAAAIKKYTDYAEKLINESLNAITSMAIEVTKEVLPPTKK